MIRGDFMKAINTLPDGYKEILTINLQKKKIGTFS